MGRYTIEIHRAAKRRLDRLPLRTAERIGAAIEALADEPRPPAAQRLAGRENEWRIRIGDYRVIYQIRDEALVILVIRIGHRRDVYR